MAGTGSDTMELPLNELSDRLQVSKQTIVRWIDRHLLDADLRWGLTDENEEIHLIELTDESLEFLESFVDQYREELVSKKEARRILKEIDKKKVNKMINKEKLEVTKIDGETRITVGSIEDFLRS
jgi:CTP-dependent riboflavin kinase